MKPQLWITHNYGAPIQGLLEPCERPYGATKAHRGGFWTSTLGDERGWLGWLREEGFLEEDRSVGERFHVGRVWELEVSQGAKIYEIDRYEDLERLIEQFPDEEPPWPGVGDPALQRRLGHFWVDWVKVGEVYDGVHLTARGEAETRMPWKRDLLRGFENKERISFNLMTPEPPNLYGWDCESTYWYRWVFGKVAELDRELTIKGDGCLTTSRK